jgi:GT2 family glycosyltransferase
MMLKNMTRVAISVVIPTLNRLNMLRQVLASLERQSMQPKEVIVVDGGSTDGTAEFVTSLGDRVTYLRQREGYTSNAKNCGILKSTGEIVAFLDDDVVPSRNWLEEIARTYEMHETAGGVGGAIIGATPSRKMSDKLLRLIEGKAYLGIIRVLSQISRSVFEVNRLPGCNMSFRKSVLERIAYDNDRSWFFDELYDKTSLGEDADTCLRVRKSGCKLLLNTEAQVLHVAHKRHLSRKAFEYASFGKLLSQHENLTYLLLKCRHYQLAEINLPRIILSRAYLLVLSLLRSIRHPSLRRVFVNDSFAAVMGLKTGYLKFLTHRSLVSTL